MIDWVELRPARQQQAVDLGLHRPTCPAACSSCRAVRSASRSASNIASSRAGSIPIRSSRRASAPTSRRSRPRAATTSRKPMPSSMRRCLPDVPFADLLELNGAVRFSDYSTSGSTTTFKAGPELEADAGPAPARLLGGRLPGAVRSASCSAPRRASTRRSTILLASTARQPQNFSNNATVRANCIAAGVPADGSYHQANPQISVIVGGNEDLEPETSKSWSSAAFGARRFAAAASRSRPIGTTSRSRARSRRSMPRSRSTIAWSTTTRRPVRWSPASADGNLTQVSGLLQNIAAIETKGIDLNVAYRTVETGVGTLGLTWNNTFLPQL